MVKKLDAIKICEQKSGQVTIGMLEIESKRAVRRCASSFKDSVLIGPFLWREGNEITNAAASRGRRDLSYATPKEMCQENES